VQVVVHGTASPARSTLSNLTLRAVGDHAVRLRAGDERQRLADISQGTNTLMPPALAAPGIEVAAGRTLAIANAPGDATVSALTATGGDGGAGIGGGGTWDAGECAGGTVTISTAAS
jgi:hypothetical protein